MPIERQVESSRVESSRVESQHRDDGEDDAGDSGGGGEANERDMSATRTRRGAGALLARAIRGDACAAGHRISLRPRLEVSRTAELLRKS